MATKARETARKASGSAKAKAVRKAKRTEMDAGMANFISVLAKAHVPRKMKLTRHFYKESIRHSQLDALQKYPVKTVYVEPNPDDPKGARVCIDCDSVLIAEYLMHVLNLRLSWKDAKGDFTFPKGYVEGYGAMPTEDVKGVTVVEGK